MDIDTTLNMKRLILNTRSGLWLLGLLLVLASCSKERPTDNTDIITGSPVEMRLQINTPSDSYAADPESDINRLRMVIFGSFGSPDAGRLILNKYYASAPEGNNLRELITSGKRDIYIIVNEPLSGGGTELDNYKNIATVSDVHSLSLIYQGANSVEIYSPKEIPMFKRQINQLIKPDSPNEISGEVERTMAKVTMKLNVLNSHFPTGKQVVIDNIIIRNLPEKSYLIAQNYTSALVTSEKQTARSTTPQAGYDVSLNNTFYVPEYIFNNPESGAYIEITGHINGEATKIGKWKVRLGDAMDDAKQYGDRYVITRNRHYTFVGDVQGYGEMDQELDVKVMVVQWNTVDQNENVGQYIYFDKVTNAGVTVAESGYNLHDEGTTTLKVSCITNIGGWHTVTRDVNGTIVHTGNPTSSVSTTTTQTVDITIPRIGELTYLQSYTVGIYHTTIAPESAGPVKSLDFTQFGGFIPNSVLTAAGWPADKLPAHGLHIAKKGVKIPPDGKSVGSDLPMPWKINQTTNTPGTAIGLGMGVSSTAAMYGPTHPAAQYCRDMGSGWFLPSFEEVKLIYYNQSTCGPSYMLGTETVYWSSSQISTNQAYAWRIMVNSGVVNQRTKIDELLIRCAKLI